nr:hypothetical protein [Tanacetum cinerariifolium]
MSSASSAITYTSVYTDSEPGRVFWGADEELSDGGSLWVIVYGNDGLPMLPVAPPSPDYIPGPKSHRHHQHHMMSMSLYNHMTLILCQSLYTLRYVAESDPEEDPEEYEEDETEDGLEEEHLAPADSAVVIPTDELVSPPEGTEPIIPPPSTDTATTGARITIRPQTSISLPPEAEVERLLSMPTLPSSPLTSLSPPSAGERLARCTTPAALPSPSLPPSLYPPPIDCRDDILESKQPPRKRLCLSTLGSRYEVGESSTRGRGVDYGFADVVKAEMRHRGIREVGYGIRDTWIDPAETVPEMAPTTLEKFNTRVTRLAELHEHDTQDLYALLEDAQDVWIIKEEAYAAREAWAHSIGLSQIVHHELQTLREQVYTQEYQLQTHQTQLQLQKTLRVMRDMRQEMGDMQAVLLALHGQPRRAGQPGGDVRVPNHQDAPRDADSHI